MSACLARPCQSRHSERHWNKKSRVRTEHDCSTFPCWRPIIFSSVLRGFSFWILPHSSHCQFLRSGRVAQQALKVFIFLPHAFAMGNGSLLTVWASSPDCSVACAQRSPKGRQLISLSLSPPYAKFLHVFSR